MQFTCKQVRQAVCTYGKRDRLQYIACFCFKATWRIDIDFKPDLEIFPRMKITYQLLRDSDHDQLCVCLDLEKRRFDGAGSSLLSFFETHVDLMTGFDQVQQNLRNGRQLADIELGSVGDR